MRKTFKYRIYASENTLTKAKTWLELCRNLYNSALAERIYAWKMQHKSLSFIYQQNELPDLKQVFPEYRQVGSQVLQDVLRRLDKAYKSFYRHNGFPRFKGQNRYDSFTLTQVGWKLENRCLSIYNLGRFKLKLSHPIQGNIKTITIHRTPTNKWYVCFSCDEVTEKELPESDKTVGIDVGIKSFLVDSDNNQIDNPKYLKRSLKELRRKQRKLSRRVKGSNRRRKSRLQVSKAHEKVSNQRSDFLHKLSAEYVKNYGTIIFEDLNIKGMTRNHKLAQSISDASWGEFIKLVDYKAEEDGRKLIKIPRFEPTSKTCSECGAINQNLTLSDRQWVCKSCGTLHDRDYNAAKNILKVGLGRSLQEITYAGR